MISKHLQRGALNGGVIAMLIGALAMAALLIYSATSGHELPFWPAMAVVAVNVLAAARLAWTVIQAKRQREAGKR